MWRRPGFDPRAGDFNIGQFEFDHDLAQKSGFLLIGIEQREAPVGPRQGQWNPGQTGAGADIQHAGPAHMRQDCERIEQVMRQHFFRFAHGGQVVGLVPFHHQREVIEHALLRIRWHGNAQRDNARGQIGGQCRNDHRGAVVCFCQQRILNTRDVKNLKACALGR